MTDKDNFEEKLLEQLTEMFRNMGMNLDKEQIRKLMEQFRSQFENLGLDAEKIAKGDVNFNFDLSQLGKMLRRGSQLKISCKISVSMYRLMPTLSKSILLR